MAPALPFCQHKGSCRVKASGSGSPSDVVKAAPSRSVVEGVIQRSTSDLEASYQTNSVHLQHCALLLYELQGGLEATSDPETEAGCGSRRCCGPVCVCATISMETLILPWSLSAVLSRPVWLRTEPPAAATAATGWLPQTT